MAIRSGVGVSVPLRCGFLPRRNTPPVTEMDHAWTRELVASQSSFRDANDRLRRIVTSYGFEPDQRAPFICECPDPVCFETVMLSLEEYDRVRNHPRWFLLAAGHEAPEERHERVVEAESGYAISEKISIAGEEAARLYRERAAA